MFSFVFRFWRNPRRDYTLPSKKDAIAVFSNTMSDFGAEISDVGKWIAEEQVTDDVGFRRMASEIGSSEIVQSARGLKDAARSVRQFLRNLRSEI